jgi:ribulose 1,5-bisphosphate carboxylase large subunit-like protein
MNNNIKAGADHHAGDGGYSIGTQERYEEFVKLRNRVPNQRIEDLMYNAGLTAQGCWDEMDDYAKQAIERFAELIVKECILTIQMGITRDGPDTEKYLRSMKHIRQIEEHFGVKE